MLQSLDKNELNKHKNFIGGVMKDKIAESLNFVFLHASPTVTKEAY